MNDLPDTSAPVFEFKIQRRGDVATVVAEVFRQGFLRSFAPEERGIVGTVVSELATNIVKYASQGLIRLQVLERNGLPGVRIEAIDQGPSISNIGRAMQDGFSTGGTLGLGLPAVRRLTDSMEISSPVGGGTRVIVVRWCRRPESDNPHLSTTPGVTPLPTNPNRRTVAAASAKPLMLSIKTWNRPKHTFQISGDRVWSTQTDHYALIAHLDALGHGTKADSAATLILEFIQRHCKTWPTEPTPDHLIALLDACHIAAIGTVGASIALVLIDRHQSILYHIGVGNISLLQFSPTGYEGISRPGSIGQHYRRPKINSFEIKKTDRFITLSDGMSCPAVRLLRNIYGPQTDESIIFEKTIGAAKLSDDSSFIIATCSNQ
ncbi:MAG: ATP-binding protein/SpoIIE family protein phosphatase [Verrucomicrobia bacterium]|nr:ATP-binding protein/SpoIIE family protein phosphatase [Verrucomicrobiota bacterium]